MSERPFTNTAFQAYLNEHELMASRCQGCGALYLPPRPLCPACFGDAMAWEPVSGRGKLTAYTTVSVGLSSMVAAGYDRGHPYCSGIVALEEGPSISAQILGVDANDPASIEIGTPLKVAFVDRGQGEERQTYLAFEAGP